MVLSILSFMGSGFFNEAVAPLCNLITELCLKCHGAQKAVIDTRLSGTYA